MPNMVGLHISPGSRNNWGLFLRSLAEQGLTLPVVYLFDDMGPADDLVEHGHDDTLVIGRFEKLRRKDLGDVKVYADKWNDRLQKDPRGEAELYFRAALPVWKSHPRVNVWAMLNEVDVEYEKQALFYIRMLELAAGEGIRLCLWNSSVGTPDYLRNTRIPYESILATTLAAKATGLEHILGLHEYAFVSHSIKWAYENTELGPHLILRYRTLANYLRQHRGLIDIVLTEVGQGAGYIAPGIDIFREDYDWLSGEWHKDAEYLVGGCAWQLGGVGEWKPANLQGRLMDSFLPHVQNAPQHAPPSPTPEPDPAPQQSCRGAPRIQFNKKYLLIAGTPSPDQEHAVFEVARAGKNSVGFSADDAMLGDLDHREVEVWGMDDTSALADEHRDFRDESYPGVELEFRTYPNDDSEDPGDEGGDDSPRSVSVVGGLHLRPGRQRDTDFEALRISRLSSALIFDQAVDDIPRLIGMGILPKRIVMRLYFDPRGWSQRVSSSELFGWFKRPITMLRDHGGIYVQWLNEPNIREESHGQNDSPVLWDSPQECNQYLLDLLRLSKDAFGDDVKFGFPGFSPKDDTPEWIAGCVEAIQAYDWVAAHAYWCDAAEDTWQLDHRDHGGYWKRYLPYNEDIILTECGNLCDAPYDTKAVQYLRYWRGLPRNVRQAFIWISSIDGQGNDFNERQHAWVTPGGVITPVPHIVGQRPD